MPFLVQPCRICGEEMNSQKEELADFPPLPTIDDGRFGIFSDTVIHRRCFVEHPLSQEFWEMLNSSIDQFDQFYPQRLILLAYVDYLLFDLMESKRIRDALSGELTVRLSEAVRRLNEAGFEAWEGAFLAVGQMTFTTSNSDVDALPSPQRVSDLLGITAHGDWWCAEYGLTKGRSVIEADRNLDYVMTAIIDWFEAWKTYPEYHKIESAIQDLQRNYLITRLSREGLIQVADLINQSDLGMQTYQYQLRNRIADDLNYRYTIRLQGNGWEVNVRDDTQTIHFPDTDSMITWLRNDIGT